MSVITTVDHLGREVDYQHDTMSEALRFASIITSNRDGRVVAVVDHAAVLAGLVS